MTRILRLLIVISFLGNVASLVAQCSGPDSLIFSRVQADNIILNWDAGAPTSYTLEYGTTGFAPGTGTTIMTSDTTITITGLTQKTQYDFYLTSTCANTDTDLIGPETVETLFFNDLGVTLLSAPTTGCDLTTMEAITLHMTNFGQSPQQLFDFSYSINGEEGNISRPFDGVYTGIAGFDSTVYTTFDVQVDLAIPGEYEFKVWTNLMEDQDRTNDTLTVIVTHQPVIDMYPYEWDFEEWKGGWLIEEEASSNVSMDFGRPNSPTIPEAASGAAAWVTNLIGDYNANEKSVLISPCFDFSNMINDPYISFALNFEGEACCDYAIAEISINAGRNWTKIGDGLNGIHWYNNDALNRWDGDGTALGWSRVQNRLFGAAGRDSVRIRYVFESDGTTEGAGIGIDDIHIYEPYDIDAAVAVVDHTSTLQCGSTTDQIQVAIENAGLSDLTSFIVNYSVNDGPSVSQTINTTISPEDRDTMVLTNTFDSAIDGDYNLRVWVTAPGDAYNANDTLFTDFTIRSLQPLPLVEDFEGADFPEGWRSSDNSSFGIDHLSPSSVYYGRLDDNQSTFDLITPNVGTLATMDSLKFDYRMVTIASAGAMGASIGTGDSLVIGISEDCGASYTNVLAIGASTHAVSADLQTIKVDLTAYAGKDIVAKFMGKRGSTNFFIDLDNINIISCPPNLGIQGDVTDASDAASMDGMITAAVLQGTGPFMYDWGSGNTTETLANLAPGDYTVTVVDAIGCTDQSTITVGACPDLGLAIIKSDETALGNDGTAMVSTAGGVAPYTIVWSTGVSTEMLWDLSAGDYTVTVIDDNGCQATSTVTIDLETSISTIPDLEALSIFPNPAIDRTQVRFELESPQSATIEVFDGMGRRIAFRASPSSQTHQMDVDTASWQSSIYFIRINVASGAVTRKLIVNRF